jgi:hypothetical protein
MIKKAYRLVCVVESVEIMDGSSRTMLNERVIIWHVRKGRMNQE